MSSAINHMKRSHRSEQRHYYAGMNRYRIAVQQQNRDSGGRLGFLGRLFRRGRETKADVGGAE